MDSIVSYGAKKVRGMVCIRSPEILAKWFFLLLASLEYPGFLFLVHLIRFSWNLPFTSLNDGQHETSRSGTSSWCVEVVSLLLKGLRSNIRP